MASALVIGGLVSACGQTSSDRTENGAMAGAGTGAAIGALAFGIGALPGAAIGAALGAGTGASRSSERVARAESPAESTPESTPPASPATVEAPPPAVEALPATINPPPPKPPTPIVPIATMRPVVVSAPRSVPAAVEPTQATAPAPTLSRDDLQVVQETLEEQGLYHGPLDGTYSAETQSAVAQYQRRHGLAETATLDAATLRHLDSDQTAHSGGSGTDVAAPRR